MRENGPLPVSRCLKKSNDYRNSSSVVFCRSSENDNTEHKYEHDEQQSWRFSIQTDKMVQQETVTTDSRVLREAYEREICYSR